MYPYYMREQAEPRKGLLEVVTAVAALLFLVACAMSNGPRLGPMTAAPQTAKALEQNRQSLTELQALAHQLQVRTEAIETQQVKTARLLENTRSDVAKLTQGHDTLSTQVATTTAKVQQLEAAVQQAAQQMAKFGDSGVLQKLAQERDDAIAQIKQKDDTVRQLTLKLQKAGIYP